MGLDLEIWVCNGGASQAALGCLWSVITLQILAILSSPNLAFPSSSPLPPREAGNK